MANSFLKNSFKAVVSLGSHTADDAMTMSVTDPVLGGVKGQEVNLPHARVRVSATQASCTHFLSRDAKSVMNCVHTDIYLTIL